MPLVRCTKTENGKTFHGWKWGEGNTSCLPKNRAIRQMIAIRYHNEGKASIYDSVVNDINDCDDGFGFNTPFDGECINFDEVNPVSIYSAFQRAAAKVLMHRPKRSRAGEIVSDIMNYFRGKNV